jgi:hypothetical protein
MVGWYIRTPAAMIVTVIFILMMFVEPPFIAYAYYQIVRKFFSVQQSLNTSTTKGSISVKEEKKPSKSEKAVLLKALVFSGTFISLWTPYTLLIVLEFITGEEIPAWFDGINNFWGYKLGRRSNLVVLPG